MKIFLTAFLATLLMVSCQKEVSFQSGNSGNTGGNGNGNGNTSGLLIKSVAVTGTETQTTTYTYDSQNRLETMSIKGVTGGMPVDSYHKFIRDGAGRIVKVLQKIADLPGTGATTDTSVTTYHYPNETTMSYDYRIFLITMNMGGGFSMSTIDSVVYSYNDDKMMAFHSFMSSSMAPGEIMSESKADFSYDGAGNLLGMKTYNDVADPGSGIFELFADYKYTYANTSVNNVYTSASAAQNFAMNGLPTTTTNVIVKMELVSNATDPAINVVITSTYVNGAGNKPVSATTVSTTTGQAAQTTNYTFFYQ